MIQAKESINNQEQNGEVVCPGEIFKNSVLCSNRLNLNGSLNDDALYDVLEDLQVLHNTY